MPDASRSASLVSLIGETELRDVRLVAVHAEVKRVPADVKVRFNAEGVSVEQNDEEIVARFEHTAEFTTVEGDLVATISLAHAARFTYRDGLKLDDESVARWALSSVYFMVYPYVRQALQDTCLRLDLPAVVLGYLKRGEMAPATVTMVVNTTKFQRHGEGDEALPFEVSEAETATLQSAHESAATRR